MRKPIKLLRIYRNAGVDVFLFVGFFDGFAKFCSSLLDFMFMIRFSDSLP